MLKSKGELLYTLDLQVLFPSHVVPVFVWLVRIIPERNASKSIGFFCCVLLFVFRIRTVKHFVLVLSHVPFLLFTPFQRTLLCGIYRISSVHKLLLTPVFAYFKSLLLKN